MSNQKSVQKQVDELKQVVDKLKGLQVKSSKSSKSSAKKADEPEPKPDSATTQLTGALAALQLKGASDSIAKKVERIEALQLKTIENIVEEKKVVGGARGMLAAAGKCLGVVASASTSNEDRLSKIKDAARALDKTKV
jgi:high-affinity K+ transport system ATPase subunit B